MITLRNFKTFKTRYDILWAPADPIGETLHDNIVKTAKKLADERFMHDAYKMFMDPNGVYLERFYSPDDAESFLDILEEIFRTSGDKRYLFERYILSMHDQPTRIPKNTTVIVSNHFSYRPTLKRIVSDMQVLSPKNNKPIRHFPHFYEDDMIHLRKLSSVDTIDEL